MTPNQYRDLSGAREMATQSLSRQYVIECSVRQVCEGAAPMAEWPNDAKSVQRPIRSERNGDTKFVSAIRNRMFCASAV